MARRKVRVVGMRLPAIPELEENDMAEKPVWLGSPASIGMMLLCIVLFVLVAFELSGGRHDAHFADLRYVDNQMDAVNNRLAVMQLSLERQHVLADIHEIRQEIRGLHSEINALRPVNASSTPVPS